MYRHTGISPRYDRDRDCDDISEVKNYDNCYKPLESRRGKK